VKYLPFLFPFEPSVSRFLQADASIAHARRDTGLITSSGLPMFFATACRTADLRAALHLTCYMDSIRRFATDILTQHNSDDIAVIEPIYGA
jgi:hypothetical protein